MATKIIPEKRIFVCDVCGEENGHRKKRAVLKIEKSALDYVGDPVCDGTVAWELCDACEVILHEDIANAIKTIKNNMDGTNKRK